MPPKMITTWAELDELNHSHYGRGKPQELLDAEWQAEKAWSDYDRAVDEYYEHGVGTFEHLSHLSARAQRFQNIVFDIYNRIYGKPAENPSGYTNETF